MTNTNQNGTDDRYQKQKEVMDLMNNTDILDQLV